LCIAATGDGKSALFAIPIVILCEYNTNYHLYPQGFPTCAHPFGIVITPTKGLANTFVYQLKRDFGLSVLSYNHETISRLQRNKVNFISGILECREWDLICLDPEHLTGKDWHAITDCEFFLSNLLQCTIDEVHLVDEWGHDFRIAFRIIGKFIRGRFPTHVSIVGLTATLLPGAPTTSICKSLGFYHNGFTLNHKTVISCQSMDVLYCVLVFLVCCLPINVNPFLRIQPYHALLPAEYNQETIQLMENDPGFMVIVSTVALSFGISIPTVLDNIGI
ncbi:hypothetical protein K435DRAFT_562288, partial [Dendrothele bispora CBS 962.96]